MSKRIMRTFKLAEVSCVDRPAQEHARVVVMKRAEEQDAKALLLKSLAAARYDLDAVEVMEKALTDGLFDTMETSDIEALIKVRADQIKKPKERDASAYARAIVEDGIAKVLFKASRRVTGVLPTAAEIARAQDEIAKAKSDAPQTKKPFRELSVDHPVKMPASMAGEDTGDAEAKLHSLAVDHQRAYNTRSCESAFAAVYSNPENRDLRERAKAQHLARALRGVGA
jgi:hypothetical protein